MNIVPSAASKGLTILARSWSNLALRSSMVILVSAEPSASFSAGSSAPFGETTGLSSSGDVEVEGSSWADMAVMQVG